MKTYIIGHIKPDLDSVVAALAFAEYTKLNGVENPTPAIIDTPNPETKFVFEKFNITPPALITATDILPEDRVILVDHNEADQRLVGLKPEQIIGIYDHHKANINFSLPVEICIMPFGSSNTVAWQLFKEIDYQLSTEIATLMLCAILSDTVGLKSATTTQKDRLAVSDLSNIAKITDIDSLTFEIFKAKSNIGSLSDEQVITNDYKILDFGKKVFIGQTETVEQDVLLNTRKAGLLNALQSIKERDGYDFIFLAVTDILKINTKLLLTGIGESELAEKAFGGTVTDNILDIGTKMSRKKEINPAIEKAISSLRGV
jgi:manganese-dependent inorganic pyrophosphatase